MPLIISGAGKIVRTAGGYAVTAVSRKIPLAPLVIGTQFVAVAAQMFQTHKATQGTYRRIDKVSGQVQEVSEQVAGVSEQVTGVSGQVQEVSEQVAGVSGQVQEVSEQVAGVGEQVELIDLKLQDLSGLTQAGFQSLQASVGVLQASTAVIGVGVAAGVALSAVNLWQTMKLREDVKQLRLEVKDGFIDLKEALKGQGTEILQRIDQVAADVEFRNHRTILAIAYGKFLQATELIKLAMSEDISIRNNDLAIAKGMLAEALANYRNPQLLSDTSAAGKLRRMECAWAIEQTMALTFQLQNQLDAVSPCLSHLQSKIRQDCFNVINSCESEDELDFLFPEIKRIHDHDLVVLESWQNQIDWMRSLPESELKLLESAEFSNLEVTPDTNSATTALAAPPEQLFYEKLKEKSHPQSLQDQMIYMMKPELRRQHQLYISQKATSAGYKSLVPSNLQQASDLAVANLYWYFKARDESNAEAIA
ncbi:hypothetical protein [Argonema antarcticum]|uniref:hypothetical protein n=1 Tax=Argonema antarcticum TaxID=2942763 RepID=UPI002011D56F|nr:hypothetical protein [Argonema antarcticum]